MSEFPRGVYRQKLRRGELPGYAPLGYLNELRTHTMVLDPERCRLVKKIFEFYSSGEYTLKDIRERITSAGLISKEGNKLSISNIQHILRNPFYYGAFRYKGELYEGKHEPLISKKLFEACQTVMAQRAHVVKRQVSEPVFRGLFMCGECGCAITSEKQKGHTYYRCTKKKGSCTQRYIREEDLADQVAETLQKVSIPKAWMESVIADLEREKDEDIHIQKQLAQNLRNEITALAEKLDRLLDAHLEGTLNRDEYVAKKQRLLDKKMEISEKLKDFEQNGHAWLEPAKRFLFRANQAETVALQRNFSEMKNFYKNLGSNRRLAARKVGVELKAPWDFLYELNSNRDFGRGDLKNTNPAKGGIHAENSILLPVKTRSKLLRLSYRM